MLRRIKLRHDRRRIEPQGRTAVIVSTHTRPARPPRTGPLRERAIDAACLLISLAGAGALALTLVGAAELPSLAWPPVRIQAEAASRRSAEPVAPSPAASRWGVHLISTSDAR